jgi:hypothetical protein
MGNCPGSRHMNQNRATITRLFKIRGERVNLSECVGELISADAVLSTLIPWGECRPEVNLK